MIFLKPIGRDIQVFFFKESLAHNCRGLPLGSSSINAIVAVVEGDMLTRV
jgi:hypothetical protein